MNVVKKFRKLQYDGKTYFYLVLCGKNCNFQKGCEFLFFVFGANYTGTALNIIKMK